MLLSPEGVCCIQNGEKGKGMDDERSLGKGQSVLDRFGRYIE